MYFLNDEGEVLDSVALAAGSARDDLLEAGFSLDFDEMKEVPDALRDPDVQERLANASEPVRSLVDFVALAGKREVEAGEPVWIENL